MGSKGKDVYQSDPRITSWVQYADYVPTTYPDQVDARYLVINKRWGTTDNYRELVKSGQRLPINFYTFYYYSRGGWYGSMTRYDDNHPGGHQTQSGWMSTGYPALSAATQFIPGRDEGVYGYLRDVVSQQLLGKLHDGDSNLPLGVLEAHKTADMFQKTVDGLTTANDYLKRGDYRGASNYFGGNPGRAALRRFDRAFKLNPLTAVASKWLELQYGWKPLIQDLYGAVKTLDRAWSPVSAKPLRVEARQFERWVSKHEGVWGTNDAARFAQQAVRTQRVKISVEYVPENQLLHDLTSVGVTNPAVLAWELLPYSFVVDWFLPVGNYLTSMTATMGLKFLRGTISSKYTADCEGQCGGGASGVIRYVGTTRHSSRLAYLERLPLGDFPAPGSLHFKNPISPIHVANGIALLVNSFGQPSGGNPRFR